MKKKTLRKVVVIFMVLMQLVIISNSVLGATTTQAPQGTTQANTIATLDGNIDNNNIAKTNNVFFIFLFICNSY